MRGTAPTVDPEDSEILVEIARRFYLNDSSKIAISSELGISRFRVARLLRQAREQGIVEIRIRDPNDASGDLVSRLKQHLKLQDLVLVNPDRSVAGERNALGKAAGQYLAAHIRPNYHVGISWGRTLMAMTNYLGTLPAAEFIQITGVIGDDPSRSPIALLGKIVQESGTSAKALIAPLFCTTSEAAQTQRDEPSVARILRLFDSLDMAVLSIGAWDTRITQLEDFLPIEDAQLLDEKGAIADSNGLFFDASGHYIDVPLNERRISISVDQLARIPIVIAAAGTLQKVNAIRALCLSGLPTCLVTTTEVAKALLSMPPITAHVYRTNTTDSTELTEH
jgi:DNA-binding transcriptional regulator LsrR (DeoR family)